MKRILLDGSEVIETDTPIDLVVHTKAPGKWKLIDMETGQEYIGSDIPNEYGLWVRIKDKLNKAGYGFDELKDFDDGYKGNSNRSNITPFRGPIR